MDPYSALPFASQQRSGKPQRPIEQNLRNQPLPPETPHRVALVDGDKNNHLAVQQALNFKPGGWILECHANPKEALRRISLSPPHIVILELALPDSSGIDFLVKLKARLPNLPILMFTECHRKHEVGFCLMAGANGLLVKPIQKGELLRVLGGRRDRSGRPLRKSPRGPVGLPSARQPPGFVSEPGPVRTGDSQCTAEWILRKGGCFPPEKGHKNRPHARLVKLFHKLGVHSRAEVLKKFSGAMRKNWADFPPRKSEDFATMPAFANKDGNFMWITQCLPHAPQFNRITSRRFDPKK